MHAARRGELRARGDRAKSTEATSGATSSVRVGWVCARRTCQHSVECGWSGAQALNGVGGDGLDELGVVLFVLVGVPIGEPADLGGELRAVPDVAVDGYRVAGAGVGAGEGPAARDGELGKAGGDQLSGRDDL